MEPQPQSQGPDLHVEKGVHIIFVQQDAEVAGPDPTPEERAEAAVAVGTVQKTDVIVFRGRPWHKIGNELFPHPDVHDIDAATILDLRVGRDKAVWWSEKRFDIERIEPDTHHGGAAGPQPFDVPATTEEMSTDATPTPIFVARSGMPITGAKNHHYKISFRRNGVLIDPNMRCS
jgi:hypothetical protein